jgi:hypothetical protein
VGAQAYRVRTCDGKYTLVDPPKGRDKLAVIKPGREAHLHRDTPAYALDYSDKIEVSFALRHAIHQPHRTVISLEVGLEDGRVSPVTTFNAAHLTDRRDLPVAVIFRSEERSENAGESNRGAHNQSMDPFLPTSAADSVSPIIA